VRVWRTGNQVVALTDEIAFLHIEHLRFRDQIFNPITFLGNNRDFALRLIVADEFDPARNFGDDRIVLRERALRTVRQRAADRR
jgi:hypothetical protein